MDLLHLHGFTELLTNWHNAHVFPTVCEGGRVGHVKMEGCEQKMTVRGMRSLVLYKINALCECGICTCTCM